MTEIICGVDISSEHLDARVGRAGPGLRVANTAEGIADRFFLISAAKFGAKRHHRNRNA